MPFASFVWCHQCAFPLVRSATQGCVSLLTDFLNIRLLDKNCKAFAFPFFSFYSFLLSLHLTYLILPVSLLRFQILCSNSLRILFCSSIFRTNMELHLSLTSCSWTAFKLELYQLAWELTLRTSLIFLRVAPKAKPLLLVDIFFKPVMLFDYG